MANTNLKINSNTKSAISLQYIQQSDYKPAQIKMASPDYKLTVSVPSAAVSKDDEMGIALEKFHEKFGLKLPENGFNIHYAGKSWIAVEA